MVNFAVNTLQTNCLQSCIHFTNEGYVRPGPVGPSAYVIVSNWAARSKMLETTGACHDECA